MRGILRTLKTWCISLLIAFLIIFIIKTFIGVPTTVKGTSMFPTFYSGEKLIVSTWDSTFDKVPRRGDCITFEAPSVDYIENADMKNPVAIYNEKEKSFMEKLAYKAFGISKSSYIKRVVGLPGEHVEIKNDKVYIDGKQLNEDYLFSTVRTNDSMGGEFYDVVVPDGCVYVLGDNRMSSADSRRFGCVPIKKIEGRAWIRWYPYKKLGTIKRGK